MKRPSTLREQIDQARREFDGWPAAKQRSVRLEGNSEWPSIVRPASVPVASVTLPAEMVATLEAIGDGSLEKGVSACLAAYRAFIP